MSESITFVDHSTIELRRAMAEDDFVLEAMLVSTLKDDQVQRYEEATKEGKINFLMEWRHGSPFEHTFFTFRVEAPIFVFREWHRHRIGISINEASARYTVLPGQFYVPPRERPLVQVGKPGHYTFEPGSLAQYDHAIFVIKGLSTLAYESYEEMIADGIAKEVARSVLPVNIFSQMYWTCNARSLMAFLSLRTAHDPYWIPYGQNEMGGDVFEKNEGGAKFPSKPQWEIAQCADIMEAHFAELMPHTHAAFVKHGRVAP